MEIYVGALELLLTNGIFVLKDILFVSNVAKIPAWSDLFDKNICFSLFSGYEQKTIKSEYFRGPFI